MRLVLPLPHARRLGPLSVIINRDLGLIHYYARQTDRAILPGYLFTHSALAAVYGQLGEVDRARAALRELDALVPGFGAIARSECGEWFDVELNEHLMDGLRKAGLEVDTHPSSEPMSSRHS